MDDEIASEGAELGAEFIRIYGELKTKEFLLLPFQTMTETIEFLRTVPDGSGKHGVLAALELREHGSSPNEQAQQ
jgi:hypothetical protein